MSLLEEAREYLWWLTLVLNQENAYVFLCILSVVEFGFFPPSAAEGTLTESVV